MVDKEKTKKEILLLGITIGTLPWILLYLFFLFGSKPKILDADALQKSLLVLIFMGLLLGLLVSLGYYYLKKRYKKLTKVLVIIVIIIYCLICLILYGLFSFIIILAGIGSG